MAGKTWYWAIKRGENPYKVETGTEFRPTSTGTGTVTFSGPFSSKREAQQTADRLNWDDRRKN